MSEYEKHATPEEIAILRGPCSKNEPCRFNPETGYVEHCVVHEPVIADICMRTPPRADGAKGDA